MGKQDAGWCEFTSKKMILLISELDHFYSVTTLWTGERSVPAFPCSENDNSKAANLTKLALRERGFPRGREKHHTACLRGGRESLELHLKCLHLWLLLRLAGQDSRTYRRLVTLHCFGIFCPEQTTQSLCSRSIWRWGRACYFSWRQSVKGSEYRNRQPRAVVF